MGLTTSDRMYSMKVSGTPQPRRKTLRNLAAGFVDGINADGGGPVVLDGFETLGNAQIDIGEVCPVGDRLGEVGLAEVRPAEVRPAEVRLPLRFAPLRSARRGLRSRRFAPLRFAPRRSARRGPPPPRSAPLRLPPATRSAREEPRPD